MESGHKSGGGASAGGGGGLCNACGYQYPNAHPSAKQRRAHRKNCGKPPSAAAAVEEGSGERDGEQFLLGEGEGGGGRGEGNVVRAADCGGGLPGSAREVGDVVENEDNAEHSSPNGTGVQDIINKFSEDCLISCDDVASEIAPKAIGIDIDEIHTEVAENAPHLEDGHPSQPAVSSGQRQDASTSVLPPEPEDGARFSSDFSVDEINNSNVMFLASNATAGEVSAQTNAIVVCPDDIAVTEVDGMINTIGKCKTSEDILVKGSEIDSSCQEKPQTKIGEGHSDATVEEDPSVNYFNVVSEEIPDEETDSKEQSRLILTNSIEQISTMKEPVNLFGNKESCTEKRVCADNTNCDDLFELATGVCHLEAPDSVKTEQQTDLTSVAEDQLTIPKQTDIEEGQHCPDADGVIIHTVSSAIGPAVGAEVISVGNAANLTKNVCSSEVTTGNGIPENVSHTSGITFMPSQVDLVELETYPTSHAIDMVSSKDGVEENRQNVDISAVLTSHEINEVRSIDVEEKQQIEDITAYTTSPEANAVCSTGNFGESKQKEGIIAEAGSYKISIIQNTSVEEKEQNEEVIANPASNKIDVISSSDIVEEKTQTEVCVETTHDINVACSIENVEGKKQNEEITADPTCEINAVNIQSNAELKKQNEETTSDPTACEINMANITDNVEEKKQNEEITTDRTHSISVICSRDSEDKKPNEDMTECPSSHEIIVVHGTYNVKENDEGTMSDPTSYQIDAVSTTDGVEEKKQNEERTAVPTSRGINVVHTIDNVEEMKNEAPTSDPTSCKIDAESNTEDIQEKRQNEEIAIDSSSHEHILQGMDNAEQKKQNEDVAADPASDKITVAQSADDAEEKKQKEETAAKEISTAQSTDDLKENDQNEEIADKEVIVDSDMNHVSLKALLAEKGVETKEKKASTKDRVLSFKRRTSKDNASPVKPGSPKAGSGHQDWNSPARFPIEKKSKGKKQQWVPFICCPSIN